MSLVLLRTFFAWCTVINLCLFFLSFLLFTFAGGWIYRIHSTLLPMSRESFNLALYGLFGIYKLLIILFNVVPYAALVWIA